MGDGCIGWWGQGAHLIVRDVQLLDHLEVV